MTGHDSITLTLKAAVSYKCHWMIMKTITTPLNMNFCQRDKFQKGSLCWNHAPGARHMGICYDSMTIERHGETLTIEAFWNVIGAFLTNHAFSFFLRWCKALESSTVSAICFVALRRSGSDRVPCTVQAAWFSVSRRNAASFSTSCLCQQ